MIKNKRLFIICRDNKVICMEEEPEKAAKRADKEKADTVLQCRVEVLYRYNEKLDWTHNLTNPNH